MPLQSVKVTEYSNQARKKGKVCVGNMQHKVKDTQQVPGADKVKVALVELQPALGKGIILYISNTFLPRNL